MRSRIALACSLTGAVALFLAGVAAGAGAPNPCSIVPSTKIAAAFHASAAPKSHLTSRHEIGKTFRTCTWGTGKNTLAITTGPSYTSGGFGGPPGMTITRPVEGLGPKSIYAHDDEPAHQFADVSFQHVPFSGDVHVNGNLPFVNILALARRVYRAE